ncbi:MAG: hypothetical protein SGI74_04260 [Oligoflexia bacterium]|nr:hypothetical protein [Oligoflexia bacterium]
MRKASGQVVLEYVLLLTVALTLGSIIMTNLIGTVDEPKGIRQVWGKLINAIGADYPDKPD